MKTFTTPTTMNANETTEFSELTHAGQCLDIYLMNTAEIYDRYTVPAIERVTRAITLLISLIAPNMNLK